MKYSFIIALITLLCITSCDGKHRSLENNLERLEKSQLSINLFKKEVFIPNSYTESVTDTILSSGTIVNVKYYTVMNQTIVANQETNNKQIVNTLYREFTSEIQVFKNDKLLFEDIIDKSNFRKSDNDLFWDKAILQYVWLDEFESTESKLSFNCSFQVPTTNAYKSYKVYFTNTGEKEIKLIEAS